MSAKLKKQKERNSHVYALKEAEQTERRFCVRGRLGFVCLSLTPESLLCKGIGGRGARPPRRPQQMGKLALTPGEASICLLVKGIKLHCPKSLRLMLLSGASVLVPYCKHLVSANILF